ISRRHLPTFPNGFPRELIDNFTELCGRDVLCNLPYSGTKVLSDFGEEHMRSGALIVYTSADSVFQIAAHEDIVPLDELYGICRKAREMLTGEYGVGRVIARPFAGEAPNFYRTDNRRDFSLEPDGLLLPEVFFDAGLASISVGKISDIFADRRFTKKVLTHSNAEGMQVTASLLDEDFCGLCFVNLVDFDMKFGHRRDVDGYARALTEFDRFIGKFIESMRDDDILFITADHGCDPAFLATTDHTREYTPLLIYSKNLLPKNLGTRDGFADIAATVADIFGLSFNCDGAPIPLQFTK
ncbi:MAG: phosphopentomutase, partial [Clostridia bacterium]|nr:phosphopentomutase [Clostridia bacterium]